jgi:methylated-DNA-[protein]-cysteine S-methyltransferase
MARNSLQTPQNTKIDAAFMIFKSPLGPLRIVAEPRGLVALDWEMDTRGLTPYSKTSGLAQHKILRQTRVQLSEYFSGERTDFDLPLAFIGTDFQKKAWSALRRIPFGRTQTYQQQAQRLGDAKWARAVGTANSKNPISIIVPCHRVTPKSGGLGGYAGGVSAKAFLLKLEGLEIS